MYKYNEIRQIHIEISTLCQASCPMCARNNHGGLPNPKLIENNMDLNFYKNTITPSLLTQLGSISMCGNFGDPIMNNDLIPMIRYTVEQNPNIDIHIHTNVDRGCRYLHTCGCLCVYVHTQDIWVSMWVSM